jgi:molybdenum cofactor cytidylyltransferase
LTVIEHVVATFLNAGIEDVLVVTGGMRAQVEGVIDKLPVRKIHNQDYASGEMLSSLQCGIREMPQATEAVLIGLGDQPQVQARSVSLIRDAYGANNARLIVPSFQMKRGHPWLVARALWNELLALKPPQSPRDFLNTHATEIQYVNMDTPTILADLDTPEDYMRFRP